MALVRIVSAGEHEALLVNRMGRWQVSFDKVLAFGGVHRVTRFDVSPRVLSVTRSGARAVVCRGRARLDLQAVVTVAPVRSTVSVLELARSVGTADPGAIDRLVTPAIEHALGAAAATLTPEEVRGRHDAFADLVRRLIDEGLRGLTVTSLDVSEVERAAPHAQGPFR